MRGHIRKRGPSWSVVVDVGRDPETGRRKQKWHGGFQTRKEAQRALTEILGRLEEGTFVERSRLTVAEFLREWLPVLETKGLRESTRSSYRMMVEKHVIPRLGAVPLQRLAPAHLNAMYAEMLSAGRRDGRGGLSARSTRYTHMVLRKALADAVRWNRVARNVADAADPPTAKAAKARAMKTWSAEELRRFLEHVGGDRLYAAFLLAATTGMRRGEVLGLRWRDLDLDKGRLSVTQTLVGEGRVSSPKTEKGRRSVALDSGTVDALRSHWERELQERLAFGPDYQDSGLVFRREDGLPLSPNAFSQTFDRLVASSGLPRIRLHDLRHTHATMALQAGVHPKVVSERLGHSTVSITLDIYSHAIPALQESAAELVAALVLSAPPAGSP